jgi:hypothetical protein
MELTKEQASECLMRHFNHIVYVEMKDEFYDVKGTNFWELCDRATKEAMDRAQKELGVK